MNIAIQVTGLTKSYGSHKVLKSLDFQIRKGEIFALLGVNGAGKTTTLECMEGLKKYDSGSISVNGKTGVQLQSSSLPAHIAPLEAVQLFAKWNGIAPDSTMLDALGINEIKRTQYHNLSTGQKRRLHLALALLGNPDIVFLDEPTAGLDVEGRLSLHDQIRRLKAQGKTLVLASHDMSEVENLCDRIAILNDGNIVFIGTPAQLTETLGEQYTIHVTTARGVTTRQTDNVSDAMLAMLEDFKEKGLTILDIKIDRGTFEQHFVEMARRKTE